MSKDDFEGKARGRPATGQGVKIGGRIPSDLAARVKAFAIAEFISDAEAVRVLLERGLNGPKK